MLPEKGHRHTGQTGMMTKPYLGESLLTREMDGGTYSMPAFRQGDCEYNLEAQSIPLREGGDQT
jgi:hypothetical protein